MMEITKRTKLIATIGPASEPERILRRLFKAGMTTIRLNFSHGDHEEHGARIVVAKKLMKEFKAPLSIMLDTKGPEIRVGKFKGGETKINTNEKITIFSDYMSYSNKECNAGEMTVSYDMSKDLKVGKTILIDDGKLQLIVDKIDKKIIETTAINSHIVKTNKRINLPGTKFSMPFLAKKDINDIKFGVKQGVDYIAASFVNTPEDIKQIRDILKEVGGESVQIISKIESQYAVDHFDEIAEATDGVMIARGDLGLEIPYYEVPTVEKMIIRKMRNIGKPVIVATQMLDSMENNPHPTRAEVTDVYFATELGADATMLSGESAAGKYPVEAVSVMSRINRQAEEQFYNKVYYDKYLETLPKNSNDKRIERAREITLKSKDGQYKFAVVRSKTGKLLHEVARFRPNTNILGVVEEEKVTTQYGITSSIFVYSNCEIYPKIREDHNEARKVVESFGGKNGDKYLVVDNHGFTEHTF